MAGIVAENLKVEKNLYHRLAACGNLPKGGALYHFAAKYSIRSRQSYWKFL